MKISKKSRGSIGGGTLYVVLIMLILGVLSFELMGGKLPSSQSNPSGQEVIVDPFVPDPTKGNLQLYTFLGHTPVPTPPITSELCSNSGGQNEFGSLVGFSPTPDGRVVDGKLRIWVIDEKPPLLAPGQTLDPNGVPQGGDLTQKRGIFPLGPTLYIFPNTVERGGTPYTPNFVKGTVNNGRDLRGPTIDSDYKQFQNGPDFVGNPSPIDLPKPGRNVFFGKRYETEYIAEFTWNISSLGLGPVLIKYNLRHMMVMVTGQRVVPLLPFNKYPAPYLTHQSIFICNFKIDHIY